MKEIANDSDSSDDDGPPPLQERAAGQRYDDSSSSNSSEDDEAEVNYHSSDDEEPEPPFPVHRRRYTQKPSSDDDDSSEEGSKPPPLQDRSTGQRHVDSSSSDSDDADMIPNPVNHRGDADRNSISSNEPRGLSFQRHFPQQRSQGRQGRRQPTQNRPPDFRTICAEQARKMTDQALMKDAREMNLQFPKTQNVIQREHLQQLWVEAKVAIRAGQKPKTDEEEENAGNIPLPPLELIPPEPLEGFWFVRQTNTGCNVSFVYPNVDENKFDSLKWQVPGKIFKPISNVSSISDIMWIAEEYANQCWNFWYVQVGLDKPVLQFNWECDERGNVSSWNMDQKGNLYVLQDDKLILVNGQFPKGEVLDDAIEATGGDYYSEHGLWLTQVKSNGETVVAKFYSPMRTSSIPPQPSNTFTFCQSWNNENLVLLQPDPQDPNFSLLKEYKPDGELCRQTMLGGNEGYRDRRVPVPFSSIAQICADDNGSVLFLVHTGEGKAVYRAEWRFKKKFDFVFQCDPNTYKISSRLAGGAWVCSGQENVTLSCLNNSFDVVFKFDLPPAIASVSP